MKREPQTLSVGVIGGGWVATARHIPSLKRAKQVEIVALVDRTPEKAEALAKRFAIPHHYSEANEMYEREHLDLVTICTPPWTHAPLAIEAMNHGCHVFTEKPMAMNTREAASMVGAAKRNSVHLCVSHNFLFSRSMSKVDRLMDKGEIGEILKVIGLQLSSPRRRLPAWYPKLPGGLFFDESPHLVYLLQRFLGSMTLGFARAVKAKPDSPQPVKSIEARFQGQTTAGYLTMFFETPVSEWVLLVLGTKRILLVDIFRDILIVMKSDGGHAPLDILGSTARFLQQVITGFISSGTLYTRRRLLYGHEVLMKRFVDSILGKAPPPITLEQGYEVVKVMEEIVEECAL